MGSRDLDSKMLTLGITLRKAWELDPWRRRRWSDADGEHRGVYEEEN